MSTVPVQLVTAPPFYSCQRRERPTDGGSEDSLPQGPRWAQTWDQASPIMHCQLFCDVCTDIYIYISSFWREVVAVMWELGLDIHVITSSMLQFRLRILSWRVQGGQVCLVCAGMKRELEQEGAHGSADYRIKKAQVHTYTLYCLALQGELHPRCLTYIVLYSLVLLSIRFGLELV